MCSSLTAQQITTNDQACDETGKSLLWCKVSLKTETEMLWESKRTSSAQKWEKKWHCASTTKP